MKKGMALEGYIMEDRTIRPLKQYDDTELRAKIQTNTDKIDNLQSKTNSIDGRVTELETHGGVEDPTKADKVSDATAGNLASLDENGNLQDSGKKPSDFAESSHIHSQIANDEDENAVVRCRFDNGAGKIELSVQSGGGDDKVATITHDKVDNLNRALNTPSSAPEDDATKLITSKAVYDALQEAEVTVDSELSLTSTNPVQNKEVYSALRKKEGTISRCNLVYDNNVWKLSNAAQTLEEMNLDAIKYCIFEIKPSGPDGSITYYAFGSLSKTWEVAGQGVLEVQVAVLGHLLSWSDQVQDEQEAERYPFVEPMTLSVESTNLFPTT